MKKTKKKPYTKRNTAYWGPDGKPRKKAVSRETFSAQVSDRLNQLEARLQNKVADAETTLATLRSSLEVLQTLMKEV